MNCKCDNEDESNNDRSCKCPGCKISRTPVSRITGSHDSWRLTNSLFPRHRLFIYRMDCAKVICGGRFVTWGHRVARCTFEHMYFAVRFRKRKFWTEARPVFSILTEGSRPHWSSNNVAAAWSWNNVGGSVLGPHKLLVVTCRITLRLSPIAFFIQSSPALQGPDR